MKIASFKDSAKKLRARHIAICPLLLTYDNNICVNRLRVLKKVGTHDPSGDEVNQPTAKY